ncbi:MAG: phosphatase PAP2 family protein [Planctomycetaceae bacterium]|nr:phosphatase PAP2 family protein [Planctomycetaceae bacterium]
MLLPLGILAFVLCYYWIDLPIAEWCRKSDISKFRIKELGTGRDFLFLAETFGTTLGAIIVTILILELDWRKRIRLFRYFAAILSVGLIVNVIKLFVVRLRPYGVDFDCADSVTPLNGISIDWMPWTSAIKSVEGSFPSGHTAMAFAAFVVLSFLYPQGKRILLILASFVGIQRIMVSAHFPSDVVAGAMIGLLIGEVWTTFSPLARFCNRLERVQPSD